jgi:hypothetical protein
MEEGAGLRGSDVDATEEAVDDATVHRRFEPGSLLSRSARGRAIWESDCAVGLRA